MAAAHAEQHIQRFCAAVSDAEIQTARQALSDALRASGQLSLLELVRCHLLSRESMHNTDPCGPGTGSTDGRPVDVRGQQRARACSDAVIRGVPLCIMDRHNSRRSPLRHRSGNTQLLPSANLAASASWATPMALFFASKLTDWCVLCPWLALQESRC